MFVLLILVGIVLFGVWFLVALNSMGGSQTQGQILPRSSIRLVSILSVIYLLLLIGWLVMAFVFR